MVVSEKMEDTLVQLAGKLIKPVNAFQYLEIITEETEHQDTELNREG